jgi:hypothetical protein
MVMCPDRKRLRLKRQSQWKISVAAATSTWTPGDYAANRAKRTAGRLTCGNDRPCPARGVKVILLLRRHRHCGKDGGRIPCPGEFSLA